MLVKFAVFTALWQASGISRNFGECGWSLVSVGPNTGIDHDNRMERQAHLKCGACSWMRL